MGAGPQKDMADVFYENKAYEKAENEYKKILKTRPEDSEVIFRLGVIYFRSGRIAQSIFMFLRVISIDPKHGKSFYNLGAIHANQGPYYDRKKAALYFKEYLTLEPSSPFREEIEKWLFKKQQP